MLTLCGDRLHRGWKKPDQIPLCVSRVDHTATPKEHSLLAAYGSLIDRVTLRLSLRRLLNSSRQLPLQGAITPIMAWSMIVRHYQFSELMIQDFVALTVALKAKTWYSNE